MPSLFDAMPAGACCGSLRAYLSVLYLHPRVNILLQHKKVQPNCPIARLDRYVYTCKQHFPHGERPSLVWNRSNTLP